MAYVYYNPNPKGKSSLDCTVRAISAVTNQSWDDSYIELCSAGLMVKNMPSTNDALDYCLAKRGFTKHFCEGCKTIEEFSNNNPDGIYVLMTGTHVVAVKFGNFYDALNTGMETPLYYYVKEKGD